MTQYLLNASAIWLLSLLMFDGFLRRQSHHGYNRFYLLFTLLLGILLPLIHWQQPETAVPKILHRQVREVITAKQTVTTALAPDVQSPQYSILWLLWIAGATITAIILIADGVKVIRYHRTGKVTREGMWTIIETGKPHAPFSFRNTLFISNKNSYSVAEWQMLIQHEARHTGMLHLADLLLLHLLRIVCWFHPLVYSYHNRLLMVHEYQADAGAADTGSYSRFLLEQSMLASAPLITHSFNRSPIKTRIMMLQINSPSRPGVRSLLLAPVIACSALFFSDTISAQNKEHDGKMAMKDNKVTFTAPANKLMLKGSENMEVSIAPYPLKLNGEKIYNSDDKASPSRPASGNIEDYLLTGLQDELSTLTDGRYSVDVHYLLVDATGAVAYYEYGGIYSKNLNGSGKEGPMGEEITKKIGDKVNKLIAALPAMTPASAAGRKVAYNPDVMLGMRKIIVKNHKVTFS